MRFLLDANLSPRLLEGLHAVHQALLLDNLPAVLADLEAGAVVSLSPTRLAVRRLPIQSGN